MKKEDCASHSEDDTEIIDKSEAKRLLLQTSSDITLYKRRWFILFIFSLINISNGVLFVGLSSISNIAARYYNVNPILIQWLSNAFLLTYALIAVPAAWVMTKWGIRLTAITVSLLHVMATFFHLIGYGNKFLYLVVTGQVFAAMAFSTILQMPSQISAVWFPENERATATSIGALMNIVGVALGFLQPTQLVKDSMDKNIMETGFLYLYFSQFAVCFIVFILTVVCFKEEPPTPPSLLPPRAESEISFIDTLRLLMNDKNFVLQSQSYGIYYGIVATFTILLTSFVTSKYPFGYAKEIGWMGFTCQLTAPVSCVLVALWLDRTHKYQYVAILLNVFSLISWLIFVIVLTQTSSFYGLFAIFIIVGVVGIPYYTAGMEHAAEMTYPVREGMSSAVILCFGSMYGFIFILTLGALIEADYIQTSGYIMVGLYAISTGFSFLSETKLKRYIAETNVAN